MIKRIGIVIGLILLAGLLFWSGSAYAQTRSTTGWRWMDSMMGINSRHANQATMMEGDVHSHNHDLDGMRQPGQGMMGTGMMGDGNMMGMVPDSTSAKPLAIDAASDAVNRYIATLGSGNLMPGDVMIYDNHAYVQVLNAETGAGAFEVLVDHATGNVYPEPGPNMMWNTAYSPMAGMGDMGMMEHSPVHDQQMMNGFAVAPEAADPISAETVVTIAQRYLDANQPGTIADSPVAFPGYYTLHIESDSNITGMLSVNAYSGQIIVHHWHGNLLEMTNADDS